ncbi:hypothetical protein [Streptomyces liangshanensis]
MLSAPGEFIDPHRVFGEAGYDITIATPGGIDQTHHADHSPVH